MTSPSRSSLPPSASAHPSVWKFNCPIHHAETRAQWRSWLEHNHKAELGVWLCSWRSVTNQPRCPYSEAVEEAICFGWIDSTAVVLDDDRGLQLFTPRKPKSSWSRLNRQRAADMEATARMTDAGREAIERAKANGFWTISDAAEDLIEPDQLAAKLDERPEARAAWDSFPPSARRQMLWWVISAVQDETKDRRIAAIVEKAVGGQRARG
jgi:uncharacterized protein YdeI (YjbR/CyaY-like superfamily)